jgi:DMSO/TMAO reductase YedYZ molybdopterin-dependent catalytic subunit
MKETRPRSEKSLPGGDTGAARPPDAPQGYARLRTFVSSFICALFSGFVASILAVVMMGVLRIWAGVATPMELFGDFVLKHIDVNTFIRLLLTFAPNSKTTPLGLALLGMIGVGTAVGLLYAFLVSVRLPAQGYRPSRNEWIIAAAFTVVMTLAGSILFWDEIRQNFFGLPIDSARAVSIVAMLLDFAVYGLVLCLTYRALLPKRALLPEKAVSLRRRQLFSRAGVAALGIGGVAGTYGLVNKYLSNYTSYDGKKSSLPDITHPITTNDQHYVVTQNAVDPTPNTDLWRLEVTGLVKNPGTYTYETVQQLPSTSRAITLECIANAIGNTLVSTSIWQGVTLRTLLAQHGGAASNASYVAIHSVDGYTMSLPLDEVLAVDALFAWRMNGAELPQRHGFPLRALIPGRYGEENPKWVTRIELTDHFVGGLYSDQGWYHGPLHTISRIDQISDPASVGQTVEISGYGFAGNRGIEKVEISVDGGSTWNKAALQPPLSQDSWVLWTWQWHPVAAGNYTITSRATDGTGAVQTSKRQGTVPNGATGYHSRTVTVQ